MTTTMMMISMLWGNTTYSVKSSADDLLRYSNKIESVGLRKVPFNYYVFRFSVTYF